MAAAVSLATLRTRIKERAEIRENYIPETQLNAMINAAIAELYRFIADINADWYLTSTSYAITAGNSGTVALPDDFYLARGCDVLDAGGEWMSLRAFNWAERNRYGDSANRAFTRYRIMGSNLILTPDPQWSGTLKLWYVKTPDVLSDDADTFDCIAGFEEYIILSCAVKFLAQEESDPTVFMAQLGAIKNDIRTVVQSRDVEEPDRIRDVWAERSVNLYDRDYYNP